MKKDIKGAVFLFFVAVITAFILNHFSPFGIAVFGQWQKSKGVVNAVSKTNDVVNASIEINNPEMIKEIVRTKQRIILDVRLFDFYELGHLPGALSFPLADFETGINRLMEIANQKSSLLIYCTGFECTDSHNFAANLEKMNFTDVKVYSGGFTQWQEMGYDIEKNEK